MKQILKWLLSVVIVAAWLLAAYLLMLLAKYYIEETIGIMSFLFAAYLIWLAKEIIRHYNEFIINY